MRIVLLLLAFVGSLLTAIPASAQADEYTVSTSVSVNSGRVFEKQGFVLSTRPVIEFDVTTCNQDGWCVDFWTVQSLAGRWTDYEDDIIVFKGFKLGKAMLQLKGAWYRVPGKELWDGEVKLSHPVFADACNAALIYEAVRGGLTDNVWTAELGCSQKLSDGWTLDATVLFAHSEWADGTSLGYKAGISYQVNEKTSVRAFVKGFVADKQVGQSDAIFGISLGRTFTFSD